MCVPLDAAVTPCNEFLPEAEAGGWGPEGGHRAYSLTFKCQVCVDGASFNTSFLRCSRFFNTSTQQLFKEIRDSKGMS